MYTIKLDNPLAGFTASSAKKGEKVKLITREFSSSEDGDLFIQRLEGLNEIINLLPKNITPSTISHLLVLIHKDGTCNVYVNELEFIGTMKTKKNKINKGDPVYIDDIADIETLMIKDVIIPENVGIMFLFSHGWRKGLYFDLTHISNPDYLLNYNLKVTLGHYLNYLFFQDLYKITNDDWEKLYSSKWFPFIGLKKKTIDNILSYIRSNWNPDELLDEIEIEVKKSLPSFIEKWEKDNLFNEHIELIKHANERFINNDYISSTSILYPRIEGILRIVNKENNSNNYKQMELSKAPTKRMQIQENRYSRILPDKFQQYLTKVYFAKFNPDEPADISRNSLGHGVVKHIDFSKKSTILGFLIIEQLYNHKPVENSDNLISF